MITRKQSIAWADDVVRADRYIIERGSIGLTVFEKVVSELFDFPLER